MQREDIEHNLALLGKVLEGYGIRKPIRVLMIGGGFMLTQVGNREVTEDIDVFVDIEGHLWSEEYQLLKQAAREVAHSAQIDAKWFSTTITDFLRISGPVPKGKLWRKFGRVLSVYVPPKGYILAHKLVVGRRKDWDDIATLLDELGISNRKKARKIVDKYITDQDTKDGEDSKLQEMLERFFPGQ